MNNNTIRVGNLRKTINEMLDEANYPQGFSLDEFSYIPSFAKKIKYCEARLKRLGSGSSRIVYLVDDNTVLKIAKNKKGLAQNETEIRNSGYYDGPSFFAKVYEHSDNNTWLEMELAVKAKPSDFKRITGYDFKFFQKFVWYTNSQYSRNRWARMMRGDRIDDETLYDLLENNDFYRELYDYLTNFQIECVGDIVRISSWGVAKRNGQDELVLIDYGLDDDVFNSYYSRR